jgi:pimeloyl-ACP methyl ester carboxylesterase
MKRPVPRFEGTAVTSRVVPLGLLAPLLAGCASAAPSLKPYVPGVPARGVVFAVDGAGGYGTTPNALSQAVADAGLPLIVRPFVWTHGQGRFLADLSDTCNTDEQGRRLAAEVLACRAEHPGRPVYVVGHSAGCGVALRAAADLPPDSVERLILIAPAVSANYDLRPALRASRAVEVFHSDRDWAYLRLGTALVGGADRSRTDAAGRVGFRPPDLPPAEAALLARLRQHPWDPALAWTGNQGGHTGAFRPDYLRAYVLPLFSPVPDERRP